MPAIGAGTATTTALPTPATMPSAHLPAEYTDRLQKSRSFGAAHRAHAAELDLQRQDELEKLQNDNVVLRAIVKRATSNPTTVNEVSEGTAALLGMQSVCPIAALALLEIISLRRNFGLDGATDRQPPGTISLESTMIWAYNAWATRDNGVHFDHLRVLHDRWANAEPENEVTSDSFRPVQGPRRCTRCKKMKHAGSGHGRSACDDGVSVALPVPYPASSPVSVASDSTVGDD